MTDPTPVLIAILTFACVILSFWSLSIAMRHIRERRELVDKIRREESAAAEAGTGNSIQSTFFRYLGILGRAVKPKKEKEISKMRKKLIQSGYRKEHAALFFYGFKALGAFSFAGLFLLAKLMIIKPMFAIYIIFFLIAAAMAGFYLPDILLTMKTRARKRKLLEGFPDALDLMVVCVEAGMGLDAAINRVAEEIRMTNKVLHEEFRLLTLELRAGKMRKDALRSFAFRTDLEEVNSLVTLLIQTDKFGTRVAQALRVYADSMRTRRFQRAEEIASKLPVKLVFPLIVFIFPSLFIVILGPAMIQVYRQFLHK